ncbi:metalloregulator ArsR/SmtB family transcription factor [Spirosoma sp. KNUC1025]|uniref:ArsR/SmtB family transcription factor n=1 Tax=Spirosoma sp. KNUC1025 TaxID=2894082 RepID=UPI00386E684A|nr:metalloregulator ArsR/SmtB family transcription factor [Spirosoma sp. KNUC1025]
MSSPLKDVKVGKTAALLKSIAHPIRLRILLALTKKSGITVSALQGQLQVELTQLSRYLKLMAGQGILRRRRKGNEIYYSIANDALQKALTVFIAQQE